MPHIYAVNGCKFLRYFNIRKISLFMLTDIQFEKSDIKTLSENNKYFFSKYNQAFDDRTKCVYLSEIQQRWLFHLVRRPKKPTYREPNYYQLISNAFLYCTSELVKRRPCSSEYKRQVECISLRPYFWI